MVISGPPEILVVCGLSFGAGAELMIDREAFTSGAAWVHGYLASDTSLTGQIPASYLVLLRPERDRKEPPLEVEEEGDPWTDAQVMRAFKMCR